MRRIYLDHSATTPLDKDVLELMIPYLKESFGNPSSIHSFGQKARAGVEDARSKIAKVLNCSGNEIIFTSGGTESDNLALRSIVQGIRSMRDVAAVRQSERQQMFVANASTAATQPLHIIVSSIEHHAVLDTAKDLEKNFGVEVDYLPVKKNGVIKLEYLERLIKENTALVSVMYANNEIGTVQPIKQLSEKLKEINKDRKNRIYFHTDAVQAAGYLELDVESLGVDALTLSAHKFYGPKGVGLLYLKSKTPFVSVMTGGGQEHNIRSGTENVAGIIGMAEALNNNSKQGTTKMVSLSDKLEKGIKISIPGAELVGGEDNQLPNIASFIFPGISAETILIALDMEGIAASSGSACTVGSIEASHVLVALGYDKHLCRSMIRFSLGKENTEKEIEYVIQKMPKIINKLKKLQ